MQHSNDLFGVFFYDISFSILLRIGHYSETSHLIIGQIYRNHHSSINSIMIPFLKLILSHVL